MSGNRSKIIAFNYFGGKFTWLEYLYHYLPAEFIHFVDLFGGSFCVSLNLRRPCIKTANEINSDITNFFQVLRDHEAELIRSLLLTPCSQAEYNRCWENTDDKIEQARRFYVRIRQSFLSLGGQRKNKGWLMAKTTSYTYGGENVSKWNNAIEKLHMVADVIRSNFQITNFDYLECIDKIDFEGAFFYADPPYLKETRASFHDYKYEFTKDQHIQLAKRLHSIKGMAMVSGYSSDLYKELYADWQMIKLPTKNNGIRSGKSKEVLWLNYEPQQHGLFKIHTHDTTY